MLSTQSKSKESITNVIKSVETAEFENKKDIVDFLNFFSQNNAFSLKEKACDLYKSPFIKLFVTFNTSNNKLHFEATMLNTSKFSNKNNYVFSLLQPDVLHSIIYFSERINEDILGTELVVERFTDSLKRHYLKSLNQLKEFSVDPESNYEDAEFIPFSQLNDAAIHDIRKILSNQNYNTNDVCKMLNNIKNQSDFDEFLSYVKNDFIFFLNRYHCNTKDDLLINSIRKMLFNGIDFMKTFNSSIELNGHATIIVLLSYFDIENDVVSHINVDCKEFIEAQELNDTMDVLYMLNHLTYLNISKSTAAALNNIFHTINAEYNPALSVYLSTEYIFKVGKIALNNRIVFINSRSLFTKLNTINTDSEKDIFIKNFISYFEKCRKVYISVEGQFVLNQFKEKWPESASGLDAIKFELFGFEGEFDESEMKSIDI